MQCPLWVKSGHFVALRFMSAFGGNESRTWMLAITRKPRVERAFRPIFHISIIESSTVAQRICGSQTHDEQAQDQNRYNLSHDTSSLESGYSD